MEEHKLNGITIKKSKISQAFALISFMVGEMIFTKVIQAPVDFSKYEGLDRVHFVNLRTKIVHDLNTKDEARLNVEESLLLYLIVDMVCKCFVSDANIILQKKAKQNMDIEESEYKQVRISYLHYAQSLLADMNQRFAGNRDFDNIVETLRKWEL